MDHCEYPIELDKLMLLLYKFFKKDLKCIVNIFAKPCYAKLIDK
jgi:hypothetical protein